MNLNSLRSFSEIGAGLLRLTLFSMILVAAVGFFNPASAATSDFWCRAPGGADYEYNCGRVDFWSDTGYGMRETKPACERRFKSVCGNPTPVRSGRSDRTPASPTTIKKPRKAPEVKAPAAEQDLDSEETAAPAPAPKKRPTPAVKAPTPEPVPPEDDDGADADDRKGPPVAAPAKPAKVAEQPPEEGPVAPVAAEAPVPPKDAKKDDAKIRDPKAVDVPAKAPVAPIVAKPVVNPNIAPKPIKTEKACATNAKQLKMSKEPSQVTLLNNLRGLLRVNLEPNSSYRLNLTGKRRDAGPICYLSGGLGACPYDDQGSKPVKDFLFAIDKDGKFSTEMSGEKRTINKICSDGVSLQMEGEFVGPKTFKFVIKTTFVGANSTSVTTFIDGGKETEMARTQSVAGANITPSGPNAKVLIAPAAPTRAVAAVNNTDAETQ